MTITRIATFGAALILATLADSAAQQRQSGNQEASALGQRPAPPPQQTIVYFPSSERMRSAWKVHWSTVSGFGLVLDGAWFKKGPREPWFQVVGDVRLSEMFVPYASGSPRFWDVSYNFALLSLTKDDAGAHGRLLGAPPVVCQEMRDRGLAWMDGTQGSRRGQTMVLWSALSAANYRYVIEYGFQDDATITVRVGSTGRNYASREFEGHMHNGLWRVAVNLDGAGRNSAYVMERLEPDGADRSQARPVHRLFQQGKEGAEDWDPLKFTMVQVRSEVKKNARNQPIAFDFMTPRTGNARHFGDQEECTHHDFWVTRNRADEIYYRDLPKYVGNRESIQNTDLVVWLSTPGHHEPRSEDGEMKDDNFTGATPIMWCGFELKPRDFWDRSPLYP